LGVPTAAAARSHSLGRTVTQLGMAAGGGLWAGRKIPSNVGRMNERVKQLLVLGREHYEKRELEKAEQMLRMVLEEEDRYADVHDMLGVIAHSRGNFLVAERHFERALEINPAYTEAALTLAVTYNDRGKSDKAREIYA
jgi:Tfp pilus assembly protein PilF